MNLLRFSVWLLALFLLCTCSLKTFTPQLTVRLTLSENNVARRARSNPPLEQMGCFIAVFHGNGDDASDSQTGGIAHSCLHFDGRVSTSASLTSARSGFSMSLAAGKYSSIEFIGLSTPAGDCSGKTITEIYAAHIPQVYVVASLGETSVSAGDQLSLTTAYNSATAVELTANCPVTGVIIPKIDNAYYTDTGTAHVGAVTFNYAGQAPPPGIDVTTETLNVATLFPFDRILNFTSTPTANHPRLSVFFYFPYFTQNKTLKLFSSGYGNDVTGSGGICDPSTASSSPEAYEMGIWNSGGAAWTQGRDSESVGSSVTAVATPDARKFVEQIAFHQNRKQIEVAVAAIGFASNPYCVELKISRMRLEVSP